ncbi:MAG: hypothetical protein EOO53_01690 [Gammaproteobacteria bacterium]|nr:MAG: hypothetical protein EOO53_01690 [Gammaproteobacteria bacterium]
MFNLHPNFSYQIHIVGEEKQPVLIVDNFLAQPQLLVDFCCENSSFSAVDTFYPGFRMQAPEEYLIAISEYLRPIIFNTFGDEGAISRLFSLFSLITTPPGKLKPEQAVPHFDSDQMTDLASVYYLCDSRFGGTSLYRHKETGFEFVDTERRTIYMDTLLKSLHQGKIKREYMNGSNELFEQIYSVPSAFNRLVMYRSTSLHSGNISKDFQFNADPKLGRLTLNTFLTR